MTSYITVWLVVGSLSVGGCLGISFGVHATRQQAIRSGVAHWTINPTTGETKFEFIKP